MCGSDQGGVVVPPEPRTALEVVESEAGFQLPVVMLDAPADLGQTHQLRQGCVLGQGGDPEVSGLGCTVGPFGQQPRLGQDTVLVAGNRAVRRTYSQRHEP